jgi:hypothetical protein
MASKRGKTVWILENVWHLFMRVETSHVRKTVPIQSQGDGKYFVKYDLNGEPNNI